MKIVVWICLLYSLSSIAFSQTESVDATQNKSTVTYRLVHPLHVIEATSKNVEFQALIDTAKEEIRTVSANVDVMTFDSGNSNRDSHAMEVIDALDFPDVKFSSTSVSQRGDTIAVTGRLTFHGVTREIGMTSISTRSRHEVDIKGMFMLSLTDFNVERPSLLMIPVNDSLRFTLNASFAWK